jgi:hypothetical protein
MPLRESTRRRFAVGLRRVLGLLQAAGAAGSAPPKTLAAGRGRRCGGRRSDSQRRHLNGPEAAGGGGRGGIPVSGAVSSSIHSILNSFLPQAAYSNRRKQMLGYEDMMNDLGFEDVFIGTRVVCPG